MFKFPPTVCLPRSTSTRPIGSWDTSAVTFCGAGICYSAYGGGARGHRSACYPVLQPPTCLHCLTLSVGGRQSHDLGDSAMESMFCVCRELQPTDRVGGAPGGYVNAPPVTLTPWPPFCGAGTLDWAQPATRLANRRLPHRNTGTDQLQLAQAIHHFAKYNVPMWALPHHTQFTGTSTLVAAAAAKHSIDTAAAAATHDGHPPVTLPVFITRNTASRLFPRFAWGAP